MSPLMQTICDHLRSYSLDRYIDGLERDTYAMEQDQLRSALAAALPEAHRGLLERYAHTFDLQSRMETEAMFQAAFAAAKELS